MEMSDIKSKLNRTGSVICPSPEELLLIAVQEGNLEKIEELIKGNSSLWNYEYPDDGTTIFPIACSEDGIKASTVEKLIKLGADLEGVQDFKPLHLAAQNPNSNILKVIIPHILKRGLVNQLDGKNNALLSLVKCDDVENGEEVFVENVSILLDSGVDVNATDAKNLTAIWWAADKGYKLIVECILRRKGVDIDRHKYKGKSARDLIVEKKLYDGVLPDRIDRKFTLKQQLFDLLRQSKQTQFIENIQDSPNEDDGYATYLQYACENGLSQAVKHLLTLGADVNKNVESNNRRSPVEIAAQEGYHEILELLLNAPNVEIHISTLCNLLKSFDYLKFPESVNHERCVEVILDKMESGEISLDVNQKDERTNPPLHYALRYANEKVVKRLLKLGASLACPNKYGQMPIEDIKADTLEHHLNHNCISGPNDRKANPEKDVEFTFHYKTLVPPGVRQKPMEEQKEKRKEFAIETEAIAYMSKSNELKHLLQHPVIVTFLIMKWHKIRKLFYANLLFYIVFLVALLTYIFGVYANFEGHEINVAYQITYAVLVLSFVCLVCRELFQILVSPRSYYRDFDNYIEIILLVVTAMIIVIDNPSEETRRKLSSIVILLCAFELILMLGNHPRFTTNVVIFKTVSKNFVVLFLWYSLLIVAFALSFNIIFKDTSIDTKNCTAKEDSFKGPGSSLFKTIVMLTGEFDASDLNFHTDPVISKLTFIIFIFMITIILLNLLNGLAVSDTQTIQENAQLVGHIARAKHIRYVEKMMVGDIFPEKLEKVLEKFACCFPCIQNRRAVFIKSFARKACLFTNRGEKELFFQLNTGRISMGDEGREWGCWKCSTGLYADKDLIRRTKEIVPRNVEESELTMVLQEYKEMKEKLDRLLRIVSKPRGE